MATQADVRRIARALPGTEEATDDFAFSVPHGGKVNGYAWVWKERRAPKEKRVPNPAVLAVRVSNNAQKDLMIAAEPAKFFTEPHYNGFPAVLVRLEAVTPRELEVLLAEAHGLMAPKPKAEPKPKAAPKRAAAERPRRE